MPFKNGVQVVEEARLFYR
jgi:DNA-binding NarL/FixJ family response regulator